MGVLQRAIGGGIVWGAVLTLIVGCGSAADDTAATSGAATPSDAAAPTGAGTPSDGPAQTEAAGPPSTRVLTFSSPGPGGPAAQVGGQLREVDGCLYITAEGTDPMVPIFRAESEPAWDNGELTFDGATYGAGDTLLLGGGEGGGGSGDGVPAACGDAPTWQVFSVESAP